MLMRKSNSGQPSKLAQEAALRAATPRPRVVVPARSVSSDQLERRRPASARRASERPSSAERSRPSSAGGARAAASPARPKAGAASARDSRAAAPMKPFDRNASVVVLRRKLLEEIVERRIFKAADIKPFLQQVARENAHVDSPRLRDAIRDVEREFYLS